MRIMIVGQDVSTQAGLHEFLSSAGDAEIVAECTVAEDIVAALADGDIEAVFLDTRGDWLPETASVYVALREKCPYLIAVVSDENSATQALERGATDFLLSPVSKSEVRQILIKLRHLTANGTPLRSHDTLGHWLQSVAHQLLKHHTKTASGRLAVKVGTRIRFISLSHVMYAQASGDYLDITMTTGEVVHTKEKITHFDSRLPKPPFIRTHRSFVINTEYVREIRSKGNDYELVLSNDTVLTTGSTYRKHVREQLLVDLA